ncbi:MAG: dCTP deaminase [Desulfobacteraceae bacterium]|jgi:deoxycytidine triphosphate deaminase
MATLTRRDILYRLKDESEKNKKLTITPIIDEDRQIGNFTIDLRLSNEFITFKTENIKGFNVLEEKEKHNLYKIQELQIIDFGSEITLHPGSLVLGSTFEYIKMPEDLAGQVDGRSSWSRLGLVIATATGIDPGFSGSITLELSNIGKSPLILTPGTRICQLSLSETKSSESYSEKRKYHSPTGPEFSKVFDDPELKILQKIKEL